MGTDIVDPLLFDPIAGYAKYEIGERSHMVVVDIGLSNCGTKAKLFMNSGKGAD